MKKKFRALAICLSILILVVMLISMAAGVSDGIETVLIFGFLSLGLLISLFGILIVYVLTQKWNDE